MSESYFFALILRYLKPQHSFAKTIKPNTKYRVVLYKGIQKCDEMKQAIKSKLVGGKIDLQSPELFFSVQFYSPLKNIQYTLKLYEEKPGEEELEIGAYAILSGDYIKKYKGSQGTGYAIEGKFKDDLGVGFDLVVQKSKYSLTDAIKALGTANTKQPKEPVDDNRSSSSKSKQLVRSGDGFISPRKRIERKSGHKGKLHSRNNSREDGDVSSEGSIASSRQRWHKSPPSKEGQHFVHIAKKASPPKINEGPLTSRSAAKSDITAKSEIGSKSVVEKKVQSKPEVTQKSYNYKPADNLKFQNTKEIFDIKIERNSSAAKSPTAEKQNIVQKPSVAKSSIISPIVKTPVINSPTPSQSIARQPNFPSNESIPLKTPSKTEFSPRSGTKDQIQTGKSTVKPVTASAKKSQKSFVDQINNNPPKQTLKQLTQINEDTENVKLKRTDSYDINKQDNPKINNSRSNTKAQERKETSEKSIQIKQKAVKRNQSSQLHQGDTSKFNKQEEQTKTVQKATQQQKQLILYILFLAVSLFLIYHAMSPSRRV